MPNFSNSPELLEPITDSDGLQTNGAPVSIEERRSVDRRGADRRSGDRRGADGRGGDRRRPENQGTWLGAERRRGGDRRAGERRVGERRSGDRRVANLIIAGRVVLATTFAAVPFVAPLPGAPLKVARANVSSSVSQSVSDVTSYVQRIGNPFTDKSIYGRNVWDMQLFNGRIYMGHGDTNSNAGPAQIWSYNPSTQSFTNEFTAPKSRSGHFASSVGSYIHRE
jgi:hypothetical protein